MELTAIATRIVALTPVEVAKKVEAAAPEI
jgi:hypothetical protein